MASAHTLPLPKDQLCRSIILVQASAFASGFFFGVVIPILSVMLERDGVSTTLIGLNASMAMIAAVLAGPFVPRIARRLGIYHTMILGLALLLVGIMLLPVVRELNAWFAFRFILGIGMVIHWSLIMTWLNTIVSEKNRGLALGINGALWGLGYAFGPVLIKSIGLNGLTPFLISGAAILGSAALLLIFRRAVPEIEVTATRHVWHAFRAAPVIMIIAFVGGFGETGLGAMLPVYGLHSGLGIEDAIIMISVLTIGGVVLGVPTGWAADRMNRWMLMIACIGCGIVGPALLPFTVHATAPLWLNLFLWGGMLVGIHSIGVTLLGQRFPASELAQANALFVMCFSAGAAGGSFASGGAMEVWDPHGLPVLLGVMFTILLIYMVIARPWRESDAQDALKADEGRG
jgi:MFS family permease